MVPDFSPSRLPRQSAPELLFRRSWNAIVRVSVPTFLAMLLQLACLATASLAQELERDTSVAGNEKVAEIMRTFAPRGTQADDSQPTPASEALKQFELRDDIALELVASEPDVAQPLFMSWDSRGRMWVVQYRQYQFPAGLKVVRYDQHLRAVFDKVPEPPPHGVPGVDKISVFEDTNGDGAYDSHQDVLTGLNIVTSVQVGNGGIWVLNPPYLLRYPDANGDDIPDGDPEVHLSGFGLQDTHSVANSLKWGPDGWLYGCNGSTTVGSVSSAVTKGVQFMGQCVWRYHPETQVFEIYAEGGGNTFSLDIDSKGRVFTGTNGGGTRGYYYPQGSYARKNWGKHGPLTNPHAFGYFSGMELEGDMRRFAQAFCIYEGGLLPDVYATTILAPNALQNLVWHSRMYRDGSTYRTVDEANLIKSPDRWFRPVFASNGPEGAFYIADWYDTRLSHVSPLDDWHKTSGRIYRVVPAGSKRVGYSHGDLHTAPSNELIAKFGDANEWVRRRAMLELGWRNDSSALPKLIDRVNNDGSLESLWAINLMGELTTDRAVDWLNNDNEHIRRWVVRLMGDRHEGHAALGKLAAREADVQVRSQLASTAKRVDVQHALPIIRQLAANGDDLDDLHMPLMIWWALEAHANEWDAIEELLAEESFWRLPLVRRELTSRLMQRYASTGTQTDLERCARLLGLAPDDESRKLLIVGLNNAFQGRSLPKLPDALASALNDYQAALGQSGLVLSLKRGSDGATKEALAVVSNASADLGLRIAVARVLGETKNSRAVKTLTNLATGRGTSEPALQRVAIQALGNFTGASIAKSLVSSFGSRISDEHGLRHTACRVLASRADWAKSLLGEVDAWRLKTTQVPVDVIQQLRTYSDPDLTAMVERNFGTVNPDSSPQKLAQMVRLREMLASNPGDAVAGKQHFTKRCGTCHELFGEGKRVGPPLDGYERGNLSFWLPAILQPSLQIREGFLTWAAVMNDGRILTGMIAAQDGNTVTLRNAENQLTVVSRADIEEIKALPTSLMPEDVLKDLTDADLRDLFAYLSQGAKR